ncbi:MAG: hypothetical protein AAGG75_04450 [Bacteroidota bacterium]
MKRISIISLCLLLLAPVFHLSLLFTFYQIQKKQLTQEHCINLYQPELDCYGKCYIQEIIAQRQSDATALPVNVEKLPVFLFCEGQEGLNFGLEEASARSMPAFQDAEGLLYVHRIFHPPQSLA